MVRYLYRKTEYILLCVGLALLSPSAKAQQIDWQSTEPVDWKGAGEWLIFFGPTDRGCSAKIDYEGGSSFFIGFQILDGTRWLVVSMWDTDWKSIKQDELYIVELIFGDETPWKFEASGYSAEEASALAFLIDPESDQYELFLQEFITESDMKWSYNGNSLGDFSLTGSRQAYEEVLRCNTAYLDAIGLSRDAVSPLAPSTEADQFSD